MKKKTVVNYTVAQGRNVHELIVAVNHLINKGWQPFASITSGFSDKDYSETPEPSSMLETVLFQPMVKNKNKKKKMEVIHAEDIQEY